MAEYMTTMPMYVLMRCSCTSMMYIGRSSIVAGNIWVTSRLSRPNFLPMNEYRENAYPAIDASTTPDTVTTKATYELLSSQVKNGRSVNNAT